MNPIPKKRNPSYKMTVESVAAVRKYARVWTRELRSGRRKQGAGALCVEKTPGVCEWCCLGVAMDECEEGEWVDAGRLDAWRFRPDVNGPYAWGVTMPPDTTIAYLMETAASAVYGDGYSLSGLNDSGRTFSQIADVIDDLVANHITEAKS